MRVATGTFSYERRGILDAGHVRFFTKRTFEKVVREEGYTIARRQNLGLPFEVLGRGGKQQTKASARMLGAIDKTLVAAWPSLFGYQFLVELRPDR
jgi:hypothetical protein